MCDLWISSDVLLCTASILNLCCISLDRYFAITRPLTYSGQRSPKLAKIMIAAVWVASVIISLPPVFGWKEAKRRAANECLLNMLLSYRIYSSMGSFYLPCLIMVFVYLRIFIVIHEREKYLNSGAAFLRRSNKSRTSDQQGKMMMRFNRRQCSTKSITSDNHQDKLKMMTLSECGESKAATAVIKESNTNSQNSELSSNHSNNNEIENNSNSQETATPQEINGVGSGLLTREKSKHLKKVLGRKNRRKNEKICPIFPCRNKILTYMSCASSGKTLKKISFVIIIKSNFFCC